MPDCAIQKEKAIKQIQYFWQLQRRRPALLNRVVLVDLFHDNEEYLLRSLVIGKYLGLIHNARTVGMMGHPGAMRPAGFNRDRVRLLAETFCLDDVVEAPQRPEGSYQPSADLDAVLPASAASPLDAAAIARLNQLRNADGLAIGRFYHDTHLRTVRAATLCADASFRETVGAVDAFHDWARQLLSPLESPIVVLGHLDYCPWGLLGEMAVRAGGTVYFFRCDGKLPVAKLGHTAVELGLNGAFHVAQGRAFAQFLHERTKDGAEGLEPYYQLLASTRGFANWRARDNAREPAPWPIKTTPPANSREVMLCMHTFCDQPAADEQLFPNHYEWIRHTLDVAAAQQQIRLHVKCHPLNADYDQFNALETLKREYAKAGNIRFTEQDKFELAAQCRVSLSVRGSVGVQLPAEGHQVMCAGRSGYSEAGTCLRASGIAEYDDYLAGGKEVAPVSETQAMKARLFPIWDRLLLASESQLIPPFRDFPGESLWPEVARRHNWHIVERDELFSSLQQHVEESCVHDSRKFDSVVGEQVAR